MKNQVVVITGASSGIGRETALLFAKKGARLVVAARRQGALDQVVAECEELGAEAIAVVTDVSVSSQVERLAAIATARFGRIDVWVNNASVAAFGTLNEVPEADFRRVLDVNIMGYVFGAKAALGAFRQQGSGVLVNVSSVLSEVPYPYLVSYSMSKAATSALNSALRQELAISRLKKVHVTSVLPSTIDTPFYGNAANYLGRVAVPPPPVYPVKPVAKAIVHAAAHPEREIVVGRAGRQLVRLHRAAPNSLDKQMAALGAATRKSGRIGVEPTANTLFEPANNAVSVSHGNWHGPSRLAKRRALTFAAIGVAGALVARGALRAR